MLAQHTCKSILITGASSGIGAACVQQAAKLNLNVIATARSKSKLQLLQKNNNNVQIIIADISTETGRNIIQQSIKLPVDYLLHNAAILDSPQKFNTINVQDFRNNILTNAEPIIFLTQKLIPQLQASVYTPRILSISSAAANYAIAGLANYCISKSAALMANQILKLELPKYGIIVNDYFPGVVNTNMQKILRNSTTETFPCSKNFKDSKQQGMLSDPIDVANDILNIFTSTDDSTFSQSNWLFNKTKQPAI